MRSVGQEEGVVRNHCVNIIGLFNAGKAGSSERQYKDSDIIVLIKKWYDGAPGVAFLRRIVCTIHPPLFSQ